MDLTPYLDNEKIATLLRAKRSGDEKWIKDAETIAREEPRLERVVDAILATKTAVGEPVPREVRTVARKDEDADAGTKGGETAPPPPTATEARTARGYSRR